MKRLLLIFVLLTSLAANSQSIEEKLKANVLKLEADEAKKMGERNGTHLADSLAASVRKEELNKATDISPEEAHFKAKYENADPARQVYQVLYELKNKQAGQEV